MKHLSTLLMSLAAASVVAAPISNHVQTPLVQRALKGATITKEAAAQMKSYAKAQFKSADKKTVALSAFSAQKAPAKVADIDVESNKINTAYYFESENDWYFSFTSVDGNYVVQLDLVNNANPGSFTGTYTTEDALLDYSYGVDYINYEYLDFAELNVVCKGLYDDYDPSIGCEVTGEAILLDGSKLNFHLLDPGPLRPTETVELAAEVLEYEFYSPDYDGKSVVLLEADGVTAIISYAGTVGSYTTDNIDPEMSGVMIGDETYLFDNGSLDVVLTEDNVLKYHADLVCENAVEYVIDAEIPFEINDQITIEAHNLSISSFLGIIYILDASTDEYPVIEAVTYSPVAPGDITEDFQIAMLDANEKEIDGLVVRSAVVTLDENNKPVVDAQFVGTDNNEYTLHMDLVMPEISEEMDLNLDGIEINDLTSSMGAFQLYYYNQEEGVEFSIVYDALEVTSGHYDSMSATYADYCVIYMDGVSYPMFWAETDLVLNDDETFTINGSCQISNIKVNFSGVGAPAAVKGDTYDSEDTDIDAVFGLEDITTFEVDPEQGIAYIAAQKGLEYTSILFFIDGDELPEGIYDINDTYAPGSVQSGLVYNGTVYPSFYALLDEEDYITVPLWYMNAGNVVVSYDAEGNPSITVDATNTWGRYIHVVINDILTGIQTVGDKAVKTGKFMEGNNIVIRTEAREYNAMGQAK